MKECKWETFLGKGVFETSCGQMMVVEDVKNLDNQNLIEELIKCPNCKEKIKLVL